MREGKFKVMMVLGGYITFLGLSQQITIQLVA